MRCMQQSKYVYILATGDYGMTDNVLKGPKLSTYSVYCSLIDHIDSHLAVQA